MPPSSMLRSKSSKKIQNPQNRIRLRSRIESSTTGVSLDIPRSLFPGLCHHPWTSHLLALFGRGSRAMNQDEKTLALCWKMMTARPDDTVWSREEMCHAFGVTEEDAARNRKRAELKWVPDKTSWKCMACDVPFQATLYFFSRRHHCRFHGWLVCDKCSPHQLRMPGMGYFEPVRVCSACYDLLKASPKTISPLLASTKQT